MRACVVALVLTTSISIVAEAQMPPLAETREVELRRARQHFEDGRKAFEAKDYTGALKEFRAGYEIEPKPGFLLNMGHAAQKTGDLAAARDFYARFLQTSPTGEERRVAQESLADIDRKLAAPAPTTTPPGGVIPLPSSTSSGSIEPGEALPPPGDPSAGGDAAKTRAVVPPPSLPNTQGPGASGSSVVLTVPAAPAEQESPIYTKWWLWTGIGIVAVGVAAFLVFGGKSDNGHDSGSWGQIKL